MSDLYNVKCVNNNLAWISFYDRNYRNHMLRAGEFKIFPEVKESDLSYYGSLSKLGLGVTWDKVAVNIPVRDSEKDAQEAVEALNKENKNEEKETTLNEQKEQNQGESNAEGLQEGGVNKEEKPAKDLKAVYEAMSKEQIKEILKELKIDFKSGATKSELVDILVKEGVDYEN